MTGYKIKIKKVRENKLILDEEISETRKTLKVSGLLPATKYKVEIATLRGDKKSKSRSIIINTLPNPPIVKGIFDLKN